MTKIIITLGFLFLHASVSADSRSYQLRDILFETNSYKLTEENTKELDVVVKTIRELIKESGKTKFTLWINGNSDLNEKDPKQLSEKRAKAIKAELIRLGLTGGKLIAKGYRTKRSVTNFSNEKGSNARVDFQIKV